MFKRRFKSTLSWVFYFVIFSVIIWLLLVLYLRTCVAPPLNKMADVLNEIVDHLDNREKEIIKKAENHCKESVKNNPEDYEICKIDKYCEYMYHPKEESKNFCIDCLKNKINIKIKTDTEDERYKRNSCILTIKGYLSLRDMKNSELLKSEQFKNLRRATISESTKLIEKTKEADKLKTTKAEVKKKPETAAEISVCQRTETIKDAILRKVKKTDCSKVTNEDLKSITSFSLSLDERFSLTYEEKLKDNDFAGFTSLKVLFLPAMRLKRLSPNQFAGLTSLQELYLYNGRLKTLSPNQFAGLTSLKKLQLQGNRLKELSPNQFAGLTSLEELDLGKNRLKNLPPNLFAGLISLKKLRLEHNRLKSLSPNQFSGLTSMFSLHLEHNRLKSLSPHQFVGLTSLSWLILSNNDLSGGLTKGVFSPIITYVGEIDLSNNDLTQHEKNRIKAEFESKSSRWGKIDLKF